MRAEREANPHARRKVRPTDTGVSLAQPDHNDLATRRNYLPGKLDAGREARAVDDGRATSTSKLEDLGLGVRTGQNTGLSP